LVLALSLLAAGCSTTMTGRKQLTLIHEDKMDAMGIAAFASLKSEGELSQDPGDQGVRHLRRPRDPRGRPARVPA